MERPEHITRQRIISVARDFFMRDGYKATSTRKIAQEVGITQPNLYHHFVNKESLYVAVLESVGEETQDKLNEIKASAPPELKAALILMTNYLKEEYPINFYMMMHDMKEELSEEISYHLYQIFRSAYQDPFIDLFKEHAKELRSEQDFRTIATYYFLVITPYIDPNTMPYQSLTVESIVELFLSGILR